MALLLIDDITNAHSRKIIYTNLLMLTIIFQMKLVAPFHQNAKKSAVVRKGVRI